MENVSNQLKVNPLNYVLNLRSPIGVYLRRDQFKKEPKADISLKKNYMRKCLPTSQRMEVG